MLDFIDSGLTGESPAVLLLLVTCRETFSIFEMIKEATRAASKSNGEKWELLVGQIIGEWLQIVDIDGE